MLQSGARKHWVCYWGLFVRLGVFLAVLGGVVALMVKGRLVHDPTIVYGIAALLALWCLAVFVYQYLLLSSVRWAIIESRISITSGVLPWKKFSYQAPFWQLFDSWYGHSFWGWLLGYGTVKIRLREGTTHEISESFMRGAKVLCAEINAGIERTQRR